MSDSLFSVNIGADPKHSTAYVMTVIQSGLAMPDRDYYLRTDPDLEKTREAYRNYLATVLEIAGSKDAAPRST